MNPNAHIYPMCVPCIDFACDVLSKMENPLIFDIGANNGGMAQTFSRYGRVEAFEPLEREYMKALEKAEEFGYNVWNLGLSDFPGAMKVDVVDSYTLVPAGARYEQKALEYKDSEGQMVVFETLDNLVKKLGKPDFIKMDVDGHELDVLNGGAEFFKHNRPPMMIELSGQARWFGVREEQYVEDLYRLGYKAWSMDGKIKCETISDLMPYYPFHTSYDVMMLQD